MYLLLLLFLILLSCGTHLRYKLVCEGEETVDDDDDDDDEDNLSQNSIGAAFSRL